MAGVKVVIAIAVAALVALGVFLILQSSRIGLGPASGGAAPRTVQTEAVKAALAESNRRAEAQRILSSLVQKYGNLRSYRDVTTWSYQGGAEPGDDGLAFTGGRESFTGSLAFASPNRIRLVLCDASVHSDGSRIWHVRPESGEYAVRDAPGHLSVGRAIPDALSPSPPWAHPAGTMLLSHGGLFRDLYPVMEDIFGADPEKRDGEMGYRVHTTARLRWIPGSPQCPVTWWISAEDELLREVRIDLTGVHGPASTSTAADGEREESSGEQAASDGTRSVLVITFDQIELDIDIPDDVFAFEPEADWRETTEFGLPASTQPSR
jgi:hypothetical protein